MFFKLFETMNRYVAYTGIVLPPDQQQILLQKFQKIIPQGWKPIAHHMTINLKTADQGPAAALLGKNVTLTVNGYGLSEAALAAAVETEIPSKNAIKHITIATAPDGRASQSNEIEKWIPIHPFTITGRIEEVEEIGEAPQPKVIKPQAEAAPDNPKDFVNYLKRKGTPRHAFRGALAGKFPGIFFSDAEIDIWAR
jgi:acyl-CoA synthetase (AMP-forming)/AMP-acid ligase II